jgi:hypothetical protein
MGYKPTRKRKRFLLYLAGCLMGGILVCGCTAGLSLSGNHDEPATVAAQHLSQGESMLLTGDYANARKESCILLEQFSGQMDDQALYLLGLVWVHPDNPQQDTHIADLCFRRIVDQHVESPLVAAAETWLALIDRLEENEQFMERMQTTSLALEQQLKVEKRKRIQLEERLQQMKAIDLNLE